MAKFDLFWPIQALFSELFTGLDRTVVYENRQNSGVWSLSLLSPVDGEGPWLAVVTPAKMLNFHHSDVIKKLWILPIWCRRKILIITIQMSDKSFELNWQYGLEGEISIIALLKSNIGFELLYCESQRFLVIFSFRNKRKYIIAFLFWRQRRTKAIQYSMGSRLWRHLWSLDSIWISIFTQRGHQVNATHKTSYNLLM